MAALPAPVAAPAATASHRTAIASILAVGGRLLSRVIDLIALLVLARLLQPSDFGLISIAMSLIFIVEAVLELPVSQVLLVERDVSRTMMDTAFTLSLLRGLVLAIVIGAMAWPFATIYGDMRLLPLILALTLAPACRGISNPRLALYNRDLDFRRTVASELLGKVMSLVVSAAVAMLTGSYWALALGTIVSPMTSALLSFVLAPYLPRLSLHDWRLFRNFLGWLSGAQLFSAFAWQIDRLVLGRLASAPVLGRFTMADNLAAIPGQVLLAPILGPLSAGLVAVREDPERLRQAYLKTLASIALLGFPVLVGTALMADEVVALALGPKWSSAAPILRGLALVGVPGLVWTPLNALALALRRSSMVFTRQLADFLVKVPLVIAGAWYFMIPGIVAARGLAAVLLAAMAIAAARSAIGVSLRAQAHAMFRPAAGCIVMTATILPALDYLPATLPAWWLAIASAGIAAAGALAFVGTVLLLWRAADCPVGGESMVIGIVRRVVLRRGGDGVAADAPPTDSRDQALALAAASVKSGGDPAASSVYRILDILAQANLAHPAGGGDAAIRAAPAPVAFRCASCGRLLPIAGRAAANVIALAARAQGFRLAPGAVEIAGRCADCGDAPATGAHRGHDG